MSIALHEWVIIALLMGLIASLAAGHVARSLKASTLTAFAWAGGAFVTITGLVITIMWFAVTVMTAA
ncbi:hypothetical protein ACFWYW_46520 [Nonomuraea sp. NPDC059023]|uniref:hypothetical protein n=1 Tax=unclassified Nonomuraea TaxID=2593643 RepID=UPI0036C9B700